MSRKQGVTEKIIEYLQALKILGKDCFFQQVTAVLYLEELIRDSFIKGFCSAAIRQHLLERDKITLQQAHEIVDSLELAHIQVNTIGSSSTSAMIAAGPVTEEVESTEPTRTNQNESTIAVSQKAERDVRKIKKSCFYCGGLIHGQNFCPARQQTCRRCGKTRHFFRVCRSMAKTSSEISVVYKFSVDHYLVSFLDGAPGCLQRTVVDVMVENIL